MKGVAVSSVRCQPLMDALFLVHDLTFGDKSQIFTPGDIAAWEVFALVGPPKVGFFQLITA
jgi:hypothetical protein